MKRLKYLRISTLILLLLGLFVILYINVVHGRPAPIPMKQELFRGAVYHRHVEVYPQFMIAHIIVIDTKIKSTRFLVTPPDNLSGDPLNARTTSQFMTEFNVQIAINGDGFSPWWSRSPLDYYPKAGDPVTPNGLAISYGKPYSDDTEPTDGISPTIYFTKRNYPTMGRRPGNVFNAISGDRMLVINGLPVAGLDDKELDPRTAIGINKNGRYLILVVIDGRQPFYSEGATFLQLARLLVKYGARYAMSVDGGGSSTMVMQGEDGLPILLNSPIDNYIPGRERPVANHLGIYIKK